MKNLTLIIAGLILPLTSSCASLNALSPNPHFGPKLEPIITTRKMAPFYLTPQDKIYQLSRDITESTETYFPQGRVISLGEKNRESRYIVSRVIEENKDKTLELLFYIGSNEKTKTKIEEQLANNEHGPAIKILSESNFHMTAIRDPRIKNSGNKVDYTLFIRNEKGETTIEASKSYLSEEITAAYLTLLQKIDSLKTKN